MLQVGEDRKPVTTDVFFPQIPANSLHIALYLQDLLNDAKENLNYIGLLRVNELLRLQFLILVSKYA